jgi:hypothetical protein
MHPRGSPLLRPVLMGKKSPLIAANAPLSCAIFVVLPRPPVIVSSKTVLPGRATSGRMLPLG